MDSRISVRPATRQDLDRLYQWRSDEDIYQWFREQDEPLDWHAHINWWQNRPDARDDLIIEHGARPVGVVSIATDGDVGIYIGEKDMWGQGIAKEVLQQALDNRTREYTAEIHIENEASQRLFESVGFEQTETDGEWLQYEYPNQEVRREIAREDGYTQGDRRADWPTN